jgi:hypothetical protein
MAIITLADLAHKVRTEEVAMKHKFLIYGPPGSGKTQLAATICQVPNIGAIYWLDLEDGLATVITSRKEDGSYYFSEEELGKILYIPIPDRTMLDPGTSKLLDIAQDKASNALAARVLTRLLTSSKVQQYDVDAQAIVPQPSDSTISFCLSKLASNDVVVIDSGSQLAHSIFSLAVEGNPNHEHGKKHWAEFTTNAVACLSAIQAARCTVIMLCHELDIEADPEIRRKAKTVPWFGSAPFSSKVGHYFGTVVRLYTDSGYRSLSTPITKLSVQGKSRFNIDSSLLTNPTMVDLLGISKRAHLASTTITEGGDPEKRQEVKTVAAQPRKVSSKPGVIKR